MESKVKEHFEKHMKSAIRINVVKTKQVVPSVSREQIEWLSILSFNQTVIMLLLDNYCSTDVEEATSIYNSVLKEILDEQFPK